MTPEMAAAIDVRESVIALGGLADDPEGGFDDVELSVESVREHALVTAAVNLRLSP